MEEEEVIRGPGPYEQYDEIAVSCQKKYFRLFSLQMQYAVHGWYAGARIMTRPPYRAGICRTKRYMPAASGRISKAVGFCLFTIDQETIIKGRQKVLKEINEKVISDYWI